MNMNDSICAECATRAGGRWPEGHCATQWEGKCSVCGETKAVVARRDWLWGEETKIPEGSWN